MEALASHIVTTYALEYRDAPEAACQRFRSLWEAQKGSPVHENSDLCTRISSLATSFRDASGYINQGGKLPDVFPKPEGNLWKACIAAELPVVLLDMIQDKHFEKQPYIFVEAVLILNAGIAMLWVSHAHPRALQVTSEKWPELSPTLAKRYFAGLCPTWNKLWSMRDDLLSPANTLHPGRTAVLTVFAHSTVVLHTHLYIEYRDGLTKIKSVVGIALAAWTHAATSLEPYKQLYSGQQCFPFQVVHLFRDSVLMLAATGVSGDRIDSIWRNTIDSAVEAVGPSKLMGAIRTALSSWPVMINTNLSSCLEALQNMVVFYGDTDGDNPADLALPSRKAYWATPMLEAIATALERQTGVNDNTAEPPDLSPKANANLCAASCFLLQFSRQGLSLRDGDPPVIDGQSAYRILSQCLLILSGIPDAKSPADPHIAQIVTAAIKQFNVTCENWADLADAFMPTPAQAIALRHVLHSLKLAAGKSWYDDLHALRSHRDRLSGIGNYQLLVKSWLRLGKALGLKETAERDQRDAQNKHLCSWMMCQYHIQPAPQSLSACTGCGDVRYCSKDCQKRDWKQGGHRTACRRLHA